MRRRMKQIYEAPRTWLTAGAILIASSFVIGYHQDQRLADLALAEMGEKPTPITIQEIYQNQNSIELTDTQLLAEIDLNKAARRSIAFGDIQETYLLVPAFAVSEIGRDRVNRLFRRNGDEGLSGRYQVGPRSERGHPIPVGILIFDITADEMPNWQIESMGLRPLGAGLNGKIVLLSGTTFDRTKWQDALAVASFDAAIIEFIGENASLLPLITPTRSAVVVDAISPNLSRLRANIFLFGIAFLLCGGLMVLKRYIPQRRRRVRNTSFGPEDNLSVSTLQFFDPIASQDELHYEDEADQPPAIVSRVLSRSAEAISRGATTRVRSRL